MSRNTTRRTCFAGGTAACAAILAVAVAARPAWTLEFPGPKPGKASAQLDGQRLTMETALIAATWSLAPEGFGLVEAVDRTTGDVIRRGGDDGFAVTLADGQSLTAAQFRRTAEPSLEALRADPDAVRAALRFSGWQATVPMVSDDGRIRAVWRAVVRDGSNYVRQELTISPATDEVPLKNVTLLAVDAPEAKAIGAVDGSPVLAGSLFLACEHPMAANRVADGVVTCRVPRYRPLRRGQTFTVSAVVGVAAAGQLRRSFLYYLDRERARPYSPFVYYISWFDIAAPDRKMNEALCLDRIHAFGRELVEKRGVKLDAFVFDDGWDDNRTLWQFHADFPKGFAPLQAAAAKYGAIIGTWISPWGGYSKAKAERLEYGKTQGFETNPHGFSLDGPKYYARFREVCAEQIRKYGVGYLKFDGVGPGDVSTGAGAEYGPDVEALLTLISDLRRLRPDLFVNTTVGTWPSPYWLWYSDSIWRSGRDVGHHGPGSTRQQWLTYRDMIAHQLHTQRGPLYPLNSLKFQSVMVAPLSLAGKLNNDPKDVTDDVRMAAASGTQMQEFFVTPSMMTPELWDAAAEAIGWSRRNADVLVDTHPVGGDPGKGEVYGYASWSPRKGILVLRNPSDRPASFQTDLATAFELPGGAARQYRLGSPWTRPADAPPRGTLDAGEVHTFELSPFQVLVLEAVPVK
ncbi:MAG TPA: hypothetical protein VMY37_10930 [Thermoguttaceae bacterium]|nr:hypothetical protein [Thermoguttaceae bacterium]